MVVRFQELLQLVDVRGCLLYGVQLLLLQNIGGSDEMAPLGIQRGIQIDLDLSRELLRLVRALMEDLLPQIARKVYAAQRQEQQQADSQRRRKRDMMLFDLRFHSCLPLRSFQGRFCRTAAPYWYGCTDSQARHHSQWFPSGETVFCSSSQVRTKVLRVPFSI